MKRIIRLIIMCICHLVYAQKESNLLPLEKQSSAYDIHVRSSSRDGDWFAFYKVYDHNSDSLFIVNRKNPEKQLYKVKVLDHQWSRDRLILRYQNRTEVLDYKNSKFHILPSCQSFGVIEQGNFLALYDSENIVIYDLDKGEVADSISAVKKVFYIAGKLYIQVENNREYSLVEWRKDKRTEIYKSSHLISNLLVLRNKAFLLYENKEHHLHDLIYYDSSLKKEYKFSQLHEFEFNYATAYQRSDGRIIINAEKTKDKRPSDSPEIWNTSDNNLIEKFKNSTTTKFLWSAVEQKLDVLSTGKLDRVVDIDNNAYFLSFSFSELQDYTLKKVPAKVYRFNLADNSYDYIDTISSNVTYSPDGRYIIYKQGRYWKLVDMNDLKCRQIDNHNFFNPYFTDQNKIYFDGSDGLWEYNIDAEDLKIQFNKEKGNHRILNAKYMSNFSNYPFELSFACRVLNENHFILEISNTSDFTKLIVERYGNQYKRILNSTYSKIVFQKIDNVKNGYLFIEENCNLPKQIIDVRRSERKKVIFRSNSDDRAQSKIRVETISYKNSEGIELKGILYYPLHFEVGKKYPMVVHVYQIQSDKINEYPLLLESSIDVGFSIRALIEKGYFVYMPDIVFDRKGTGISALDCVNSSLDALTGNKLIDFEKIGLTGHSHGGYITNFIATHSDRFATYVSGAGNSDIVRSYFSINEYFVSPFYWQFENGQYEMNVPFLADKNLYFKNNPIYNVENVTRPILLWSGKKDLNIESGQAMEFYAGLKRNNKAAILLIYPNEGHTLVSKEASRDLHQKTLEWFGFYLKGERKASWMY